MSRFLPTTKALGTNYAREMRT